MKHQKNLDLEILHQYTPGMLIKISQKAEDPEEEEEFMDSEDSDDNQSIMCAVMSKRANYVCFKPLMYYNKHLDRNYYYRYFKPYTFDHRLC